MALDKSKKKGVTKFIGSLADIMAEKAAGTLEPGVYYETNDQLRVRIFRAITNSEFTSENGNFQNVELSPAFLNVIPNLSPVPLNPDDVEIKVNGVRVNYNGITVNSSGVFYVNAQILGYSVDVGDIISVVYFS